MTRTIDETLERFTFVHGSGAVDESTACIMTATAWRMGLSWTDTPDCTHPLIRRAVVRLNDRMRTDDLADAFRLLADPIAGTASLPDVRAAWCVAALDWNGTLGGVAAFAARMSDTISATDFYGADLRKVSLSWSNFEGASLDGADFRQASLIGASLIGASLIKADLRESNLDGADFRKADFHGASLDGASLTGASLIGADFRAASLIGANFRKANLEGADFRGASLGGADLDGASLIGAKASSSTVWPARFYPAARGVVTA